jgi:hypothetical protein
MKQLLLLIAVYALIVNQISKNPDKKDQVVPVKKELQSVNHIEKTMTATTPANSQPKDFITPVFNYAAFRLISSYPLYSTLPYRP